uniref:Uncharacterized protein n=2 Tax=viral metagenome TaxID=1070528 RepID=A0A6M3K6N1_9ZZZZ
MNKFRIQFDISDNVLCQLKQWKEKGGYSSYGEVFKKALALYKLVVEETSKGGQILLINKKKEKQLIIL